MPAVAKTSDDDIVRAARRIVERDGTVGLSMQSVANEVGVRAPSLYKRFTDRAALLGAVEASALASTDAHSDAPRRQASLRSISRRWAVPTGISPRATLACTR